MLGRSHQDLDLTTSATPDEIERAASTAGRTRRGTSAATSAPSAAARGPGRSRSRPTGPRRYDPASRKPEVAYGDSLEVDLRRRDFTVNAMAVSLPDRQLRRPVRRCGRPRARRCCARRAARRTPSPTTRCGCCAPPGSRPSSASPSTPEVVEAMTAWPSGSRSSPPNGSATSSSSSCCAPHPRRGLALLVDTGLAEHVLPELPALPLERDEHHRHKDVYEHTLTVLEQAIDLEERLGGGRPGLRHALRRAHARRRQAPHPALPGRRHGDLPPPRRRRRQAHPQADAGAALLQRGHRRRLPAGRAAPAVPRLRLAGSGPTPRCAATSATPGTCWPACTSSPAPTARPATSGRPTGSDGPTTSSRSASPRWPSRRSSTRCAPTSTGTRSWRSWGSGPVRDVGRAYAHLLELRMDRGPLAPDEAEAELRAWWEQQTSGS